jgi:hypothetical protein
MTAIAKLRGKAKKVELIEPDQYRVESEKGSAIVNGNVKNLLQNPIIIENLNITYGAPAQKPGVEDVKTYLAEDEGSAVSVSKSDMAALREFVVGEGSEVESVTENVSRVFVHPARGPFSGDPKQWWFTRGGKPFKATIKDRRFLDNYGQGNPRLNSEDVLEVELLEQQ